jgi:hypothetical protein
MGTEVIEVTVVKVTMCLAPNCTAFFSVVERSLFGGTTSLHIPGMTADALQAITNSDHPTGEYVCTAIFSVENRSRFMQDD